MPITVIDPTAVYWLLAVVILPIILVFSASLMTLVAVVPGLARDLRPHVDRDETAATAFTGRGLYSLPSAASASLATVVDPNEAPTLPFRALEERPGAASWA